MATTTILSKAVSDAATSILSHSSYPPQPPPPSSLAKQTNASPNPPDDDGNSTPLPPTPQPPTTRLHILIHPLPPHPRPRLPRLHDPDLPRLRRRPLPTRATLPRPSPHPVLNHHLPLSPVLPHRDGILRLQALVESAVQERDELRLLTRVQHAQDERVPVLQHEWVLPERRRVSVPARQGVGEDWAM